MQDQFQDTFVSRAIRARAPLYPSRAPQAVPSRRALRPAAEPVGLTLDMLRDIVIEQIG